jgi:putative PIN family toxin of toxin-antitoxin system
MRIVLDTNIYISGILFGGNSKVIIDMILEGKFELFITEEIIKEINDVLLRPKFDFSPEIVRHLVSEIDLISKIVIPKIKHNIIERDFDDNIIIDCAIECNVDCIVTGDNDLLVIKKFKGIEILNPKDFLSKTKI